MKLIIYLIFETMKFMRNYFLTTVVFILVSFTVFASGPRYFFNDVPGMDENGETETTWFTKAVGSLAHMGITTGYSDGTFRPSNNVNRAELAVFLYRLYNYIDNPKHDQTWSEYSNEDYSVK